MSFHIGQLVVCVDAGPFRNELFRHKPHSLVCGRVYTVAALTPTPRQCVYLAEVDRKIIWEPERFRPVDETRLAIFRQALTTAPKTEPVS